MSASSPAILLIVDLQQGLVEPPPEDGPRSTPSLASNAKAILNRWRQLHYPLVHIHHDAKHPLDPLHPSHPETNAAHSCVTPLPGEIVRHKTTSSAFTSDYDGKSLLEVLQALKTPSGADAGKEEKQQKRLVIIGMDGAQCVNSTARSASDLGFNVTVVADASASFATADWRGGDGAGKSAEETHELAMGILAGGYATVVTTEELLRGLEK